MPAHDPPSQRPNSDSGDDRWGPKKHSLGNLDRPDPRETQAITLSRGLHHDLSGALTFFNALATRLVDKLGVQLPQLRTNLQSTALSHNDDGRKCLDPNLSWNVIQDSKLLAKTVSAVENLQLILHDHSVVGDPARRNFGEVPIQFLLRNLEDLSRDQEFGNAGSERPVNQLESIDVSLKGIFSRHRDELAKLMTIPS